MNPNPPVRSVAVVGGGVVARAAALAFARALPGVAVTLVPAPVDPAALSDWFPVLFAGARATIDRWGMAEDVLLGGGIAAPRLATRFDDWGPAPWLSAEGGAQASGGGGAVHQRWLAAAADRPPFHDLLPAAAMARAGTFAPDPPPPLDAADHGLRFDPRALAEALDAGLARAGAAVGAPFAAVERGEGDRIAAVRRGDGTRVAADLFVDATGPAARLSPGDAPFHDWSAALPADRLLIAAAPPAPTLVDAYRRTAEGWTAHWPGPRRSLRVVAYAAAHADAAAARRGFDDPAIPAAAVAIAPGRRPSSWRGNCLAIGEAAAQFGALGLAGFSFAQAQLALALELFAPRTMPPLLLAEYDRRAGLHADGLRDWLAAHHLPVAGGPDGRFWRDWRPPATLAAMLDQFAQRGTLPHRDEPGVAPAAWHAALIGQGVRPRRADPVAIAAAPAALARALAGDARALALAAAALPPHAPRSRRAP